MEFFSFFLQALVALLPVVNPIGMAPFFLDLTKEATQEERHLIALQVALYSFILLVTSLLVGNYILKIFGLSIPFVSIAGGCIVFNTAWGMLDTKPRLSEKEQEETKKTKSLDKSIVFFPLTMPITAGTGSIAITISLSGYATRTSKPLSTLITDFAGIITGIFALALAIFICYRYAESIFKTLGHVGTNVVSKLAAFILLAIGVEIIWYGLKPLIVTLHELSA